MWRLPVGQTAIRRFPINSFLPALVQGVCCTPRTTNQVLGLTNRNGFNNNLPIPFEVVNVTRANMPIDVFVPDVNRNGVWDVDERIVFLEQVDGLLTATWEVRMDDVGSVREMEMFFIWPHGNPLPRGDMFSFRTVAAATESTLAAQELRDIYVVPNPYVATSVFEPRNPIARTERGERRLYFANVPQQCTIRIYTLAGELVETLYHESTLDDGKVSGICGPRII